MLDTTRAFETPEGIELELRVAGPVVRACAWFIDALIRLLIYTVIGIVLGVLDRTGAGIYAICAFLVEWFYPVVFEVYRGTTPGKKQFGLLVCHDDGTPISWQASMTRNMLRVADFLPFLYGFGLISMLCNRDFKRLGDLAAGTLVVYKSDAQHEYHIPPAKPLALPSPLKLEEQRAILDFAERTQQLSESRRQELATILQEYSGADTGQASDTLFRYANWIVHGGQATQKGVTDK